MQRWAPRSLSIVIPVYNEAGNVAPLARSVLESARELGLPFELVFVDDGSSDTTLAELRALLPRNPELVVVTLSRNFGQTLALQAGFDRSRGDAVVTMDGDGQNDPRDISRLLEELARGADVVSGWRRERQDTLVLRKIPSWIANGLIRRVTGVTIHDQGCSLKAYRRDVIEGLDLYSDMHRFIGVLTMALGARIVEVEVQHHPRMGGTSKYGLTRVFKVISDLLAIQMITWFRDNPLRWFAVIGTPALAAALIFALLGPWAAPGSIVLPAAAFLTFTTFVSCLLCGLLGELILQAAGEARGGRIVAREWGEDA